ncbi:unnamed protein product [Didymodactylos carnosus]|uniref:Monocarboxylate transporter n=1 Tax=Didymodactylos carnosus TaxID=1234261 RepID=A0A8S2MBM3_9BILA|nr:unnamed protein product [Didymodactylos carnosus]CAF3948038.1 unnamed protein product [Didymodactylos carnosus]
MGKKKTENTIDETLQLNKTNGDLPQYEYVTNPPDGGFGWVIALAAMMCNLVCDGTLFAFGAMKPYLKDSFQTSDMLILMVGSIPCGVYLLVGPIVSGLANKFGCRLIIIIGSIGAAACMLLSTWSKTVYHMMIIYGIFGGIFFGMVYLPSVVMVSFYFDKKRAVANGLVTAGTGIGALSFGPLANFLFSKFGWQIGMYIFAGMMLSCILFGAIMIPLKPQKIPIEYAEPETLPVYNDKSRLPPYSDLENNTKASLLSPIASNDLRTSGGSTAIVPGTDDIAPLVNNSSRARTISTSSKASSGAARMNLSVITNPEDAGRALYRKDIFLSSTHNLNRSPSTHNLSIETGAGKYMASATNIPAQIQQEEAENRKPSRLKAFMDILVAMLDFSILKNKQMLLICIGNIFSMLGYYLPIMCLVSFAIDDLKVPQAKASFLLTVFGAANTIGRFASGWLIFIPYLNSLRVHNGLLFLAGILTCMAAYAYNFTTAALYAGLCGFAIAPHMSLLPSIICDVVGLDRYTNAFGILFLFRGVTSIIGPPAAGYVKDATSRYDMAFAIGGAMIIIAACFHFTLGCFGLSKAEQSATAIQDEPRGPVTDDEEIHPMKTTLTDKTRNHVVA